MAQPVQLINALVFAFVQCFAPDCNHQSERETCSFFRFPSEHSQKATRNKWISLIRRADRLPNDCSRVCSCHFRDGTRHDLPEIFERNKLKFFPVVEHPRKKKKKLKTETVLSTPIDDQNYPVAATSSSTGSLGDALMQTDRLQVVRRVSNVILEHTPQEIQREEKELQASSMDRVLYKLRHLEDEVSKLRGELSDTRRELTVSKKNGDKMEQELKESKSRIEKLESQSTQCQCGVVTPKLKSVKYKIENIEILRKNLEAHKEWIDKLESTLASQSQEDERIMVKQEIEEDSLGQSPSEESRLTVGLPTDQGERCPGPVGLSCSRDPSFGEAVGQAQPM